MHALAVIDGLEKPNKELTQEVARKGAFAFHEEWRHAMRAAGWRDGGHETNHDLLYTAHIREWPLLVDGQRKPLLDLEGSKLEAVWEDGDDDAA